MSESISISDLEATDGLRRELRFEPGRLRKLRTALFKKFAGVDAALAELPVDVRDEFARRVDFHSLAIHSRTDSEIDGATKLVLRTQGGYLIESVILRTGTGRVSLCVSSQVGCAAGCSFCATGQMGVAKNLSAAEIVDQVMLAGELLAGEGRRVRNIVFMGMGEPFHNEVELYDALGRLVAGPLFHWPGGRMLVSTVGIPEGMIRCVRRFPEVNLALSLHSVRQSVRERLIPLATRFSLHDLRTTLEALNALQPGTVMIEYLMLAGVNDTDDDARKLADWLGGLRVHVNLIPYNPIVGSPELLPSDRVRRDAFAAIVREAGFATTIRYSLGADIAAACGQLVQRENRQIARQQALAVVD